MSLQITRQDLRLLEKYRLDRLRTLFQKTLGLCFLKLENDTLSVHCPEPWLIDRLMNDLSQILNSAQAVTGARYVALYYASEQIHKAKTRSVKSASM